MLRLLIALSLLLALPALAAPRVRTTARTAASSPVRLNIPATDCGTTLTATRGQQPVLTRATSGTYQCGGTLRTAASGEWRVEAAGVVVEPQRVNYLINSEDFTAAGGGWTVGAGITITPNQCSLPGLAATMEGAAATSENAWFKSFSGVPSTTTVAGSVHIAPNAGAQVAKFYVRSGNLSGAVSACTCGRSDGGSCAVAENDTSAICTVTLTTPATGTIRAWASVTFADAATAFVLAAIPGTGNNLCYGGGGIEPGSYASSYIPTTGTPTQRNADAPADVHGISGGDWYVKGTYESALHNWTTPGPFGFWGVGTSTAANSARAYVNGPNIVVDVYDAAGAAKTATLAHGFGATYTAHRIAVCITASGDVSLYIDGALTAPTLSGAGTGIIAAMPPAVAFGTYAATREFAGNVRNFEMGTGCRP
jgi:hypothetical protein